MARLTSRFIVDFLIRKAQTDGGFACILSKGDANSGGILVQCLDRGQTTIFLERRTDFDGKISWNPSGPDQKSPENDRISYVERRKKNDPDLWLIELDIANAEQFIVENCQFS